MKLQKIILCLAAAFSAFGVSLGLLEIGAYIRAAAQPIITRFKPIEALQPPIVYAPPGSDSAEPFLTPVEERETEVKNEFDSKEGYYYIFSKIPKGFKDFEYFHLSIRDYDQKIKKPVPAKPEGWLDTKQYRYKYSSVRLTERKFSFVTETHRGTNYRFDGDFIEPEIINDEDKGIYNVEIFLKGRLTKLRNGKKIAEAKVKMAFTIGC